MSDTFAGFVFGFLFSSDVPDFTGLLTGPQTLCKYTNTSASSYAISVLHVVAFGNGFKHKS